MKKEELSIVLENAKKAINEISIKDLKRNVKSLYEDVINDDCSGCYITYLDKYNDDGFDYALVMGVTDGVEDSTDKYSNEKFSISMKFARQPSNSCMQCDYDFDWEYPYNKDGNGDCVVYDEAIYEDSFKGIKDTLLWDVEHFFNDVCSLNE